MKDRNSHFPFSDLNSLQIADLLSAFLARNRLDRPRRGGEGNYS